MKCAFAFLIVTLLIYQASYAQTATIVLQPDSVQGKDAYVQSVYSNANSNYNDALYAMAWTWNSVPGVTRSLIEFDLSQIPLGATILDAKLSLFHQFPSAMPASIIGHSQLSGTNETVFQRITSAWQEDSVTWNNKPATTTQNEVVFPASTSPTQDYIVNVTPLVQDIVNDPNNSFGIQYKMQTESFYRGVFFYSSDAVDPANRPKLEVTYSDPCTVYDTVNITVIDTVIVYDTLNITTYDTILVSVTDTLIIDVFTGLSPPNSYNTISVYPNPTYNLLFIDNGNYSLLSNYTLNIINSSGQQVFNSPINVPAFTVNMSQFGGPGLYFLQIINPTNQVVQEKKILLN